MSKYTNEKKPKSFENLISELCRLILVEGDNLPEEPFAAYVTNLKDSEISILNGTENGSEKALVIAKNEVNLYLKKHYDQKSSQGLFVFDSGG